MRSTNRYLIGLAACVFFIGILAACDSKTPLDAGANDSGIVDAGTADAGLDAGSPLDAGLDASTICADGNETFETAWDAQLDNPDGVSDSIGCPGDIDYFAFDGTEGDFVRLFVRPQGMVMGTRVDPVLILYGVDGTQLAENDDGVEGFGPIGNHPMIITRLPVTGRYVVQVDEWGNWSGEAEAVGDPLLTYDLHVVSINADSEDAVVDAETGDDAASATPLRFLTRTLDVTYAFGYALGTFEDETDIDVFSFEITDAADTVSVGVTMHQPGPAASGSTMRAGHLYITDSTGAEIIARTDTSMDPGLFRVAPTLANGTYLLHVDRSAESAGSNDFYGLSITLSPRENPREMDDAGNATLAGAETIAFQTFGENQYGALISFLAPGDVDYFSFTVPDGFVLMNYGCSAAWDGSGLRGLTAELRDSSDAVIASAVEDDALPAQLLVTADDFGELRAGTYALKLFATGQDATVTGDWARCGVLLGPTGLASP